MRIFIIILAIIGLFYSSITKATKKEPVIVTSSKSIDPYSMIKEGELLLKDGDIVTRLNQDPASYFIKNFNRNDKSYSHAGIVVIEKGYPFVYHIVNGEESPDEKMRKDSLNWFCNPRKNLAFGIYRYNFSTAEIINLKTILNKWYVKGLQFDRAFNLKTDYKMYCSEMISKLLLKATKNRIITGTTTLNSAEAKSCSIYMHLPLAYTSNMQIVSIDNLYIHSYCSLIKKFDYNFSQQIN